MNELKRYKVLKQYEQYYKVNAIMQDQKEEQEVKQVTGLVSWTDTPLIPMPTDAPSLTVIKGGRQS